MNMQQFVTVALQSTDDTIAVYNLLKIPGLKIAHAYLNVL